MKTSPASKMHIFQEPLLPEEHQGNKFQQAFSEANLDMLS